MTWKDDRPAVLARLAAIEEVQAAHGSVIAAHSLAIAALEDRVAALEWPDEPEPEPPPDPLDGAFLTHLPTTVGRAGEADAIAARITEGVCTGGFVYGTPSEPMGNPARWTPYLLGDPFPVLFSPKNITGAAEWCAQWSEAWRPHLLVEFWQEPQGDFHGNEAAFHAPVRELAAVCADHGIRTGVHLETYHLGPVQPDGGTPGARALLEPVADVIDFCTWSIFEFNLRPQCVDHVGRMAEFMASYPLSWGATAVGVSVPYGTATPAQRDLRVDLLDGIYTAQAGTPATIAGHYSVPQGPDQSRDFYDDQVAAMLAAMLGQVTS